MPAQRHSQHTPTSLYAYLGVTCHLHFWQNDQGLLHATAVTKRWNGHQIRVSRESWLWRRKFCHRSSRDLNPQSFSHESGALPTSCPSSWCTIETLVFHWHGFLYQCAALVVSFVLILACLRANMLITQRVPLYSHGAHFSYMIIVKPSVYRIQTTL